MGIHTIVEELNNNVSYLIPLDIENGLMKIFMDKKLITIFFHVYVPLIGQLGRGPKQGFN